MDEFIDGINDQVMQKISNASKDEVEVILEGLEDIVDTVKIISGSLD